tara:strand:+ start:5073 stop:8147 length:3075 start_codon:yes stop_codon:yes gene_type:complete
VAREDYSNRTRETIHRNWLFNKTHALATGLNDNLKDTFIYNQNWYTQGSKCPGFYYFLDGSTAGDRLAPPKIRRELVLGLMNRYRALPSTGVDAEDGQRGGIDEGFVPDFLHGYRIGSCQDPDHNPGNDDGNDDDDDGNPPPPPPGGGGAGAGGAAGGGSNPGGGGDSEPIPLKYSYAYFDYKRSGSHTDIPECDERIPNSVDGRRVCQDNPLWPDVPYGPIGFPWHNHSHNWMHNQPPAVERTPFRPIFLFDLRTTNNPVVPEGGFVQSARLVLTASQQSIAWPLGGFTCEIWNLVEGVDENCTWFSKTGEEDDLTLDDKGNTLGDWYTTSSNGSDGIRKDQIWGATAHYLPDPVHSSVSPRDFKFNNQTWSWRVSPDDNFDYIGNMTSLTFRLPPGAEKDGWANNHYVGAPIWDTEDSRYGNWFWHMYVNQWGGGNAHQATCYYSYCGGYANDNSAGGNQEHCYEENCGSDGPGDFPNCSPDNSRWMGWHPGALEGLGEQEYELGKKVPRASETQGYTGCGGAVNIGWRGMDGFITSDASGVPGSEEESPRFNYDGTPITEQNANNNPNEFQPLNIKNAITFHVPKFLNNNPERPARVAPVGTNVDSTVGSPQGINIPGSDFWRNYHGTGATGYKDGRGITFAVDVSELTRHCIGSKDQKLHLLFKGEYVPQYFEDGANYDKNAGGLESHIAIVDTNHQVRYRRPQSYDNYGSWFNNSFRARQFFRTSAAQIATNFYSSDCEAPSKTVPLSFKGKGSTIDVHTGNVNVEFILENAIGQLIEPQKIRVTIDPNEPEEVKMLERFNKFALKMSPTDEFEFFDSPSHQLNPPFGESHDTDEFKYRVIGSEMTDISTTLDVTGAQALYPGMHTNANRPQTVGPEGCRIEGLHYINLDDEYYVEYRGIAKPLETFTDDVMIPEFYSENGITSGNRDIIECSFGDHTDPNHKSFTVEEIDYSSPDDQLVIERCKVKEKVVEGHAHPNPAPVMVSRINHRPRLEITYRSKRQYDRPGDPEGGVPDNSGD